jgi:hypothetical protein
MEQYTSGIRRQLAALHGLDRQTAKSERAILDASSGRLQEVQKEIEALRPAVSIDPLAAQRYEALVMERGRLNQIIERSESVVTP